MEDGALNWRGQVYGPCGALIDLLIVGIDGVGLRFWMNLWSWCNFVWLAINRRGPVVMVACCRPR